MKQHLIETSLIRLLQSLPPSVASRVYEKYESDRSQFINFVKEQEHSKDPKFWASQNCTKCYGRGIIGTLTNSDGKNSVLMCACISKNYNKWLIELRKKYNSSFEGAGT